jgi:hypothetical protein
MASISLTNCTGGATTSHAPIWYYDDILCPLCESLEIIGDLQESLEEIYIRCEDLDDNASRLESRVSELKHENDP